MEEGALKVIFSEILRGYTLVESEAFGKIRVKHFTNFDSAELDIKNKAFYDKALEEGLPTRKQRIDYLIKEGIWTKEKNKNVLDLKALIAGLRKSKSKVFLKAHIDDINTRINQAELDLSKAELEKEEMIGFCAEVYASRRINEHYMYNALLAESGEKLFGEEEFEELNADNVMELIKLYNQSTENFNSIGLKKISLAPFFTNLFYLCENNAQVFFGKPLVDLTFYQIELFGYARYYKAMMENSEAKVPEEIKEDPERLIDWFNSTKSARETLDKSEIAGKEGAATSLVGATQQDLERLGLDNPDETINLAKQAAKKGGSLTMEDMMKLHGM